MSETAIPTEYGLEESVLRWLEEVGWEVYGLAEDGGIVEGAAVLDAEYDRQTNEVVYWDLLREWLVETDVNPEIDADNVDEFLGALRRELAHDNLADANQAFHQLLREGKTFTVTRDDDTTETVYVDLVATDDPEQNRFVAANQFRVNRDADIRPDVVLFVNGIPLVTMELKSLARDNDYFDAIADLQDYEDRVSRLFAPGLFNVAADTMAARYGAVGAPTEHYMPWSDAPEAYADPDNELRQTIRALCNPGTVVDLLDQFVLFEDQPGGTAKIVPRHMQYYGTTELLADVEAGVDRGLVWHTQGSGKSITMLYVARRLLREGILPSPQVLLVVDTDDLCTQMEKQLSRLAFSRYEVAKTGDHLQELLEQGRSELVLTTIQKFHDVDPGVQGNEHTVILSDEAHRYMEMDLGSRLDAALPDAHHFGFTGTPVRERLRDTFGHFEHPDRDEPYLHRYSIKEGIDDDLIVPVHFTLRHQMDWAIDEEGLDDEFDAEFASLPPEEKSEVIQEHVTSREIAELRPRVEEIVQRIDEHFRGVEQNGWKGMVVTPSRRAAALYGEELQKYRDPEEIAVLYTSADGDDDPIVQQFYTAPEERDELVRKFKQEDENPKLLVVCDMLLTGFDAPILKAMYLDRNLRDHNLLQAIARTNRPAEGKANGEIVDFQGVFANVDEALDYSAEIREHAAQDREALFDEFEGVLEKLLSLFEGIERTDSQETLNQCLARISSQPEQREFKQGYRRLQDLYESLSPDAALVEEGYQQQYNWLTTIWVAFRRTTNRDESPEDDLRNETLSILEDNVDIDRIHDEFPVYELSAEHLEAVQDVPEPAVKAASVEHALREHLQPRVDKNPKYDALSERLNDIIHRWQGGDMADPDAAEMLERLEREALEVEEEIAEQGQNQAEYAIYTRLADDDQGEGLPEDESEALAAAIWERFDDHVDRGFDGWRHNPDTRQEIRRHLILTLAGEDHQDLARDDELLEDLRDYLIENAD